MGTIEHDQTVPVPEGTTVDDWVIFVSPRELEVRNPSGGFLLEFNIRVFAEREPNGWRIICNSEAQDAVIPGTANYMLLRK